MKLRAYHSPLSISIIVMMVAVCIVPIQAQLPVRTRQVQLLSNNNTNYTTLRSADGQTTNWSLIQPTTVGTTGSLQLSTVTGSDAQLSWLAPGLPGYILGLAAGIPAWVDPATYLSGSFWALTGNAATNPATNFLGTTDAQPLVIRTNATEAMRVLSTGQVGIGTATPGELLEVEDGNVLIGTSAAGSTGELRLEEAGANGNNYVGFQAADAMAANTTYTLPDAYPSVNNYVLAATTAGVMNWQDANALVDNFWSLDGNAGTNPATQYLGTQDAQPLVIRTNATEAVRINATGEVGIGTTAAAGYLLHVDGTAGTPNIRFTSVSGIANASIPGGFDRVLISDATGNVDQASYAAVVGTTAWTLTGNAGTSVATNFVGTTDNVGLVFRTNNTEVARFNATGEFGLGTTAAAGYRLHVAGTGGTPNVRIASLSSDAATVPSGEGVVTADANGDLRRRSANDLYTILGIGRGIYTPGAAGSSFTVTTTGFDIAAGATVNITVFGPTGGAVHAMLTSISAATDQFSFTTSATIDATYSIHWMIFNP